MSETTGYYGFACGCRFIAAENPRESVQTEWCGYHLAMEERAAAVRKQEREECALTAEAVMDACRGKTTPCACDTDVPKAIRARKDD